MDTDLQGQGSYCTYCLRKVEGDSVVKSEDDRLKSVYCSKDCQVKSKAQSDNLLFGLDPVLPPELDAGLGRLTKDERDKTQTKFAAYLGSQEKLAPIMVARFVARQVAIETGKMNPNKTTLSPTDLPNLVDDGEDYGLYDHMERLRFINAKVSDDETKMLCDVLATALPGLEKSVDAERYATYLGKMTYNAFGVCYEGGRDDKVSPISISLQFSSVLILNFLQPQPKERPEDQERTRTPYGTSRQIGSGFYVVSSYVRLRRGSQTVVAHASPLDSPLVRSVRAAVFQFRELRTSPHC